MSIDWSKMRTAADLAAEQAQAAYEAWKVERQARVDALVVEVDGLVFDGNEISTRRMADVIAAADDLADATEWTLADNRVVVVTVRQLKQALRLSTASRTAIWNDGRPA
ncbi:DUF4376 domain-containing protein [Aeromonas caviae]|uniref:DUF4376 domain-containing protein n=1 Tax=Aeromonas caviae TaxID=648 RepID=UPI00224E08F9|nr:DUF4376 domain-containing protein [Aeromonas caviae]MCX4037768.1 DUF4376 domain-containing protein [Aeromonas caviae]